MTGQSVGGGESSFLNQELGLKKLAWLKCNCICSHNPIYQIDLLKVMGYLFFVLDIQSHSPRADTDFSHAWEAAF